MCCTISGLYRTHTSVTLQKDITDPDSNRCQPLCTRTFVLSHIVQGHYWSRLKLSSATLHKGICPPQSVTLYRDITDQDSNRCQSLCTRTFVLSHFAKVQYWSRLKSSRVILQKDRTDPDWNCHQPLCTRTFVLSHFAQILDQSMIHTEHNKQAIKPCKRLQSQGQGYVKQMAYHCSKLNAYCLLSCRACNIDFLPLPAHCELASWSRSSKRAW